MSKLSFWKNRGFSGNGGIQCDCMKRLAPSVNSGLASGGLETTRKRRKEEVLANVSYSGGRGVRHWTFMLLNSCGLWVTCGAKWGSKRAKRGVFRT